MSEEFWAGYWFTVTASLLFAFLMFLVLFQLNPIAALIGSISSILGFWIGLKSFIKSLRRLIRRELEERTKGTK